MVWHVVRMAPSSIHRLLQAINIFKVACCSSYYYFFFLVVDLRELPVIHGDGSIQALNQTLYGHEREHDLVISMSYT